MAGNIASAKASTKSMRVGAALREEREARKVSLRKFALEVDISQAQLSRIETGQTKLEIALVAKILTKLDVKGARYEQILSWLDGPDTQQWIATSGADQAQQSAALVEFEAGASQIFEFAALLVPGLLQVAPYARAIMSRGTVPPSEVTTRVLTRMGRRDVIDPSRTANPAAFTAVLDEGVLTRVIGSPAVMVEQLEHLLTVTSWAHTDIRVASLKNANWHPGLSGGFLLIEPRNSDGIPIVSIGSRRASLILHANEDVAEYRESADAVLRAAMSPDETTTLIAAAIKEMRRR